MKQTVKIKWGELKVGLLIVGAIVVLLWASFSGSGTSIFESKIKYHSYFANVSGLVKGAPVWIAGVEVGNISSIEFVNLDSARQIEVKYRVAKSIRKMITIDATIKLGTIGFIGDKYIEIIPGTLGRPLIDEGGLLPSIPAGDLSTVFSESEKAIVGARGLTKNLEELTGRMKEGKGTVGQLFTNDTLFHEMTKMIAAMTILINDLQNSQERIVTSLENITDDVDEVAAKIRSNEGTTGKFLNDPGIYDNLHSSTGRVDSILARIDRGDGTVGALVNDDELYQEVKNLIVKIENLVTDIEQNPRKYFKFSVF